MLNSCHHIGLTNHIAFLTAKILANIRTTRMHISPMTLRDALAMRNNFHKVVKKALHSLILTGKWDNQRG